MKITSLDRNIKETLSSGYYIIPRFQRPFSWEKDQITEFWEDLTSEVEIDYFIGSFVVYKISENDENVVHPINETQGKNKINCVQEGVQDGPDKKEL